MNLSSAWLLLVGIPLLQAAENPGIKMTIQYANAEIPSQHTIYLQQDRKRMEYQGSFGVGNRDGSIRPVYGPHLASITRCDLGQMFTLNLDTREYSSALYPPKSFTQDELKARGLDKPLAYVSDKPTLRIEVTTTDTGERKEIFGRTARHVITTKKQIPLEGSASGPQETVTDAWYIDSLSGGIDLKQRLSCDRKWPEGKNSHGFIYARSGDRPIDRPAFVSIGEPERGLALNSVMKRTGSYTTHDGATKEFNSKMEMRVTQLQEGPLDPALFEIPAGFKQVDRVEQNPPASALASPPQDLWQRVRASLSGLFNK